MSLLFPPRDRGKALAAAQARKCSKASEPHPTSARYFHNQKSHFCVPFCVPIYSMHIRCLSHFSDKRACLVDITGTSCSMQVQTLEISEALLTTEPTPSIVHTALLLPLDCLSRDVIPAAAGCRWSRRITLKAITISSASRCIRYHSIGCLSRQPQMGQAAQQQQQAQSQALMVPQQDTYLNSRAEALHNVESTITELGGIFQQLAHMVSLSDLPIPAQIPFPLHLRGKLSDSRSPPFEGTDLSPPPLPPSLPFFPSFDFTWVDLSTRCQHSQAVFEQVFSNIVLGWDVWTWEAHRA